jgi:hypothetical protein
MEHIVDPSHTSIIINNNQAFTLHAILQLRAPLAPCSPRST